MKIFFDTNVYVHAALNTPGKQACVELVFDEIRLLKIFLHQQIVKELDRNLRSPQLHAVYDARAEAAEVIYNFEYPDEYLLAHYRSVGLVKGYSILAWTASIRWQS